MVDKKNFLERQGPFRRQAAEYESSAKQSKLLILFPAPGLVDQIIENDTEITSDVKDIFIKQKFNLFCLEGMAPEQANKDLKENIDPKKVLKAAALKFLEFIESNLHDLRGRDMVLADLQEVGPYFWQAAQLAQKKGFTTNFDPQEFEVIAHHIRDVGRIMLDTRPRPS